MKKKRKTPEGKPLWQVLDMNRTPDLFGTSIDECDRIPDFDGSTYDPALDHNRLAKQLGRVYDLMKDGHWRTLFMISVEVGDPEASVSARLRDLRKDKFGGYNVENRRHSKDSGLWEYRINGKVKKPFDNPTEKSE